MGRCFVNSSHSKNLVAWALLSRRGFSLTCRPQFCCTSFRADCVNMGKRMRTEQAEQKRRFCHVLGRFIRHSAHRTDVFSCLDITCRVFSTLFHALFLILAYSALLMALLCLRYMSLLVSAAKRKKGRESHSAMTKNIGCPFGYSS